MQQEELQINEQESQAKTQKMQADTELDKAKLNVRAEKNYQLMFNEI